MVPSSIGKRPVLLAAGGWQPAAGWYPALAVFHALRWPDWRANLFLYLSPVHSVLNRPGPCSQPRRTSLSGAGLFSIESPISDNRL
jgi:hypothetical protein